MPFPRKEGILDENSVRAYILWHREAAFKKYVDRQKKGRKEDKKLGRRKEELTNTQNTALSSLVPLTAVSDQGE